MLSAAPVLDGGLSTLPPAVATASGIIQTQQTDLDFILTRASDKATAKLMEALSKGTFHAQVELHFTAPADDGGTAVYKVKLEKVRVTSYNLNGLASDGPLGTFTLLAETATLSTTIVRDGTETTQHDDFGRVKVQFHWDREGQKDDNSSCWIRVSQVHAGRDAGSLFIPEANDVVLITFSNGDPNPPIIIGRVFNPPDPPPPTRPGGLSEIAFEDKPGKAIDHDATKVARLARDAAFDKWQFTTEPPGPSAGKGHEGWIELISFGHYVDPPSATGGRWDPANVHDFILTKKNDKATPLPTDTIGSNQTISIGANEPPAAGPKAANDIVVKGKKILEN